MTGLPDRDTTGELLGRLLGPPGPELTCDQCFEQLDAYVELEIEQGVAHADGAVPGMSAHLRGCQACDEEHQSLLALVQDERAT